MAIRICVSLFLACASFALGGDTTTTTTIIYYNDLVKNLPMQHGKCVAITGTTSGLGYWTAVAAARKGAACVIMLNRNSSRAVRAQEDVKKEALAGVDVITVLADLQNLSSVREAATRVDQIVSKYGGLDVLALNAGIYAVPDDRTPDGFDVQMQTNHLSHFLLTKLLMPSLGKAGASRGDVRIVTHSSMARAPKADPNISHYVKSLPGTLGGGGDGSEAAQRRYHQTKLANIAFSMRLHSKLANAKYSAFKSLSAAPGVAATEVFKNMPWSQRLRDLLDKYILLSAADGSCSILTAMFDPSAKSGDFYEPKFIVNGPPLKVIDQGVPSFLSEIPRRIVFQLPDKAICTADVGDKVWHDSEEGLGEKFIIGEDMPLIV